MGAVIPVSIRPGQMALTRTPVPASWNAVVCASDTTAALDAEYGVDPAFDRRPATDAVPMMLPPEEGFDAEVLAIAGAAYFAARKTLFERGERVIQTGLGFGEHVYDLPSHVDVENF